MATKKPVRNNKKATKKYFSPAEANATLPLVRAIVRDITELARELQERHDRLERMQAEKTGLGPAYQEELHYIRTELERNQERMREYEHELNNLGAVLKDYRIGLIDFPSKMEDREILLCWKLGEPEVAFWHEMDAGFAGRHKLMVDAAGH